MRRSVADASCDAAGRLSAQTNADNEAIGFTYRATSDLLTLVDTRGKQTSWGYHVYGRVTCEANTTLARKSHRKQVWGAGRAPMVRFPG